MYHDLKRHSLHAIETVMTQQSSATKLRLALLRAAEAELDRGVTDEDSSVTIEQYFKAVGWGFWIADAGYVNVEKFAWCGVFVGAMGLRVGDFLEPDRCVDIFLNPAIAKYVLPSTVRLGSDNKWRQAGYTSMQTGIYQGLFEDELVKKFKGAIKGCVATVGEGFYGSHIVIIRDVDLDKGTFTTVEGNATKNGFEGVVSKERDISSVKILWMPQPRHFESLL